MCPQIGFTRVTRPQTHIFVHGSATTGLRTAGDPALGSGSRESSRRPSPVFAFARRALGRCVGSELAEQRCSSPPSAQAARCETAHVYARYTVNSGADAKAQFTSRLPDRPRRASQIAAETAPRPLRTAKQTTR